MRDPVNADITASPKHDNRLYNLRFALEPQPILKHTHRALLTLVGHAQTPNAAIRSLSSGVHMNETELGLRFLLSADMAALRIPRLAPPRCADELWRHTCFEAFIATASGSLYHEFNFSPSGEWAAYAFSAYRERSTAALSIDPRIAVRPAVNTLDLEATLPRAALPPGDQLLLGLCAVIEDRSGRMSCWALRHPPGKPDFHERASFAHTLNLEPS
jgi:hypothetical protein